LDILGLQYGPLQKLHRDAFKYNLKLKEIYIQDNKIERLHSKMFSHLKLTDLWLKGNICVNKSFVDPSPADIEEALQKCEENYDECPESDECLKALENRLAEKIDQNFELITGRIDEQNKENARKLKEIEKTTNEKFQKFEDKFELMVQLYYQLYEKNKDNSKHIREISQTVEKILEMLTPSKIQPISVVNKRWKTK
jgi:hypothetical protein